MELFRIHDNGTEFSNGTQHFFDTCYGTNNASVRLAYYIKNLPASTVLMGVIQDDATWSLQDSAVQAMASLGIDISHLEFRDKLVFVTQKGKPSLTKYEIRPAGGETLQVSYQISGDYPLS